jgi:Polyketide cyclase / dehydrase and lipid transport
MKAVTATVTVPQPRDEVFEFLDVLANHEQFTDHFLVDWELSGPAAGVGAKAHMRVKSPGPDDWLDMTVISGERPRTTTEESIGAKGRRRTRGTYTLEELPGGGTRITFELDWLKAPLSERLMAPITRAVVGRANQKSLRQLVDALENRQKEEAR